MRIIKNLIFCVAFILVLTILFSHQVFADGNSFGDKDRIELTQEEENWLNENHTVKIRVSNWPPYMIVDESHSPAIVEGIAIEYIEEILNFNGIKYEYIMPSAYSFAAALESVSNKTGVDLVPTAQYTEERSKSILFTQVYIQSPWVIFYKR